MGSFKIFVSRRMPLVPLLSSAQQAVLVNHETGFFTLGACVLLYIDT